MNITTIPRKSDSELQMQVLRELEWDPRVDETEVGVQVKNCVVTLTGRIGSFARKTAAAQAAHRVEGVQDVANDLEVVIPGGEARSDTDIARAVREALQWNVFVDEKKIRSTVMNGWVMLEGDVPTLHLKEAASRAIRDILGVRGVSNEIAVKGQRISSETIRSSIESALARQAEREAKRISIRVMDGVVTLSGTVRSWSERNAVERAAGFAPGVVRVQDELTVDGYS